MFRFANPQYIWLLAAIPLFFALFWLAQRNRRRRLARFGCLATIEELMPDVSNGRVVLKFILFSTAFALLVLAAARPQLGSKLREQKSRGIEMMLVVDVSNSMLAEDFEPNRLERTKYAIGKLFDGVHQDRVGLVVFAGEPKVQLPITSDYRMAKAFARRIDPSLVSVQGTAVGKALEQALLSFSGDTEQTHGRVIILITDGENHDDDALAVAQRAKEAGVRIFTIGIGTPEGAPVRIDGESVRRSSRSGSTRSSSASTRWSRPNYRPCSSRSSTSSINTCSPRLWCCSSSSCCCSTAAIRCWPT